MNKSTPIVQLPSNQQPAQNFMNDQQRQYITQAQQAISNTTIPQNSQLSTDIVNDDDLVVQDILNQINSSTNMNNNEQAINMQQYQAQQMQQPQQVMMQQPQQVMMQQPVSFQQQPQVQNVQDLFTQAFDNNQIVQESAYKTFLQQFADDIKLGGIVFIVVIIIHFVPVSTWIARYIAIDKVPYHDIILRAILATLLVVILKRLIKI